MLICCVFALLLPLASSYFFCSVSPALRKDTIGVWYPDAVAKHFYGCHGDDYNSPRLLESQCKGWRIGEGNANKAHSAIPSPYDREGQPGRGVYQGHYLVVDCGAADGQGIAEGTTDNVRVYKCDSYTQSLADLDCSSPGERMDLTNVNLLVPQLRTYEEASESCRKMSGHLASVTTKFEDDITMKPFNIRELEKYCGFIGFSDAEEEGVWFWENEELATYTNWLKSSDINWDQPNNAAQYTNPTLDENQAAVCFDGFRPAVPPNYRNSDGTVPTWDPPTNEWKWFDVGPPKKVNPLFKGAGNNRAYPICRFAKLEIREAENWSDWNEWTVCSARCGGGERSRNRTCSSGHTCTGPSSEKVSCNSHTCPIHGKWGSWGYWGTCTKNCGSGRRTRNRKCDAPAPSNGGNYCTGGSSEQALCNVHSCPTHGDWGDWNEWGPCSENCGIGTHTRTRKCDSPVPSNGGHDCPDESFRSEGCYAGPCKAGVWGLWGNWGPCDADCGKSGYITRTRDCLRGPPCSGDYTQQDVCVAGSCGEESWGDWGSWSDCDYNGNCRKTRTRECEVGDTGAGYETAPGPRHLLSCTGITRQNSECCRSSSYYG